MDPAAQPMPPFHLAFPVTDLEATRRFFVDVLGCTEGRSAARWVDFDWRGHQLSAHLVEHVAAAATNEVDADTVPSRHFGLVLPWAAWHALADRLRAAGAHFLIEPRIRFVGEVGEQATLFVADPSGNAIELKAFKDPSRLFATEDAP